MQSTATTSTRDPGLSGKTVCHGGWLEHDRADPRRNRWRWSTPAASGAPAADAPRRRGLAPADVTDLLLTHAHHDHMVNWTMFGEPHRHRANEMAWPREPWGTTPVPELM